MGLEDLAVSTLNSLNLSTVDNKELQEEFNKAIKYPPIKILFEALALCTIQGGIAMNQYFLTTTAWIFIPKLAFIPFHIINAETYFNSSEMHSNTQEIMSYQQKIKEEYSGVSEDAKPDNVKKILKTINIDTMSIPDYGIIEYKNFLTIKAEYWMGQPKYLIDTQFIKVGFPNILKFLRVALDSLPYNIPVYFYSLKSGGLTKPWLASRIIPASKGTSNDNMIESFDSNQIYTLNKFQYSTSSDDNKIEFEITLVSSLFGLYKIKDDSNEESTKKTNYTNEKASGQDVAQ